MYGSDVLPGPVILLALGLYVVTVWGRSSVDDGSGNVLILYWGGGIILLGLGLAAVTLWHYVCSKINSFDSASLPAGSSGHTPC